MQEKFGEKEEKKKLFWPHFDRKGCRRQVSQVVGCPKAEAKQKNAVAPLFQKVFKLTVVLPTILHENLFGFVLQYHIMFKTDWSACYLMLSTREFFKTKNCKSHGKSFTWKPCETWRKVKKGTTSIFSIFPSLFWLTFSVKTHHRVATTMFLHLWVSCPCKLFAFLFSMLVRDETQSAIHLLIPWNGLSE